MGPKILPRVKFLAVGPSDFLFSPKLRAHRLCFDRCDALPACINDRTLITLLRQCGRGTNRLVLHGCSRSVLTLHSARESLAINAIPQSPPHTSRACTRPDSPSDSSLAAIVRFCPSLRHVDIGRHGSRCSDACPKCTVGALHSWLVLMC